MVANSTAVQTSPPYLHKNFQFSRYMTGHVSHNLNCPDCSPILARAIYSYYRSFLQLVSRSCVMEQFATKVWLCISLTYMHVCMY